VAHQIFRVDLLSITCNDLQQANLFVDIQFHNNPDCVVGIWMIKLKGTSRAQNKALRSLSTEDVSAPEDVHNGDSAEDKDLVAVLLPESLELEGQHPLAGAGADRVRKPPHRRRRDCGHR
jgi:hypothetical protein